MEAQLKVTLGRRTYEIEIKPTESVLDAALRNNIDAPYSCMEGVCTACMAVIREGEVDFPDDTILGEDERAEGRTLTCQARLKSGCPRLVIDYDAV